MKYKIALIQMDTQNNYEENLKVIEEKVVEAFQNGASLVSLPENMNIITMDPKENVMEEIPGRTTNLLCKLAKDMNIWIHGGSIKENSGTEKGYNTTVMINPDGKIIAKYRKLHLFDVSLKTGDTVTNIFESDRNLAGSEIVNVDTEIGNLGFTICYDLRFPELYRELVLRGAQIIFVPANFTYKTGEAHWTTLLRARAIENGCFIVAAAQTGVKPMIDVYGHSTVIDPWGNILVEAGMETGIVYAEIDLDKVETVRNQIPSLKNRREDVYEITIK